LEAGKFRSLAVAWIYAVRQPPFPGTFAPVPAPPSPAVLRAARALVLCAGLGAGLGTCGIAGGIGGLLHEPTPVTIGAHEARSSEQVAEALSVELEAAIAAAPHRRPLAAANIVVSCLLVGASFLALGRRAAGPWWVTQACAANAIWTIAEAVSRSLALFENADRLVPLLARSVELSPHPTSAPPLPPADPHALLWVYVLAVAVPAGIAILAYSFLVWRVRRPDIRAILVARPTG
jgi:hypothetical protein